MALVECGHCGWTEAIPEELSEDEIKVVSIEAYAQHMWDEHPLLAPEDAVAVGYIRAKAKIHGPQNGAATRRGNNGYASEEEG